MESNFSHTSVMLKEAVDLLDIRPDLTYADLTTGGGGHSYEIAKRLGKSGRLLCFDRDPEAIAAARHRLSAFEDKITFIHENFSELPRIIKELGIDNLFGVIADLGCSSHQFDVAERGFSYQQSAPLDMRMNPKDPISAYHVVNEYSEDKLVKILFEYGEEHFAKRIASAIGKARAVSPIQTTTELAELIRGAIPAQARAEGHHPAKRSFQAIRIEVNHELDAIRPALLGAIDALLPGGRVSVISFHSLEDRLVKTAFAEAATGCTCPKDFPVCVCGGKPKVKILTKKPLLPSKEEEELNPRARSAKLRGVEKI